MPIMEGSARPIGATSKRVTECWILHHIPELGLVVGDTSGTPHLIPWIDLYEGFYFRTLNGLSPVLQGELTDKIPYPFALWTLTGELIIEPKKWAIYSAGWGEVTEDSRGYTHYLWAAYVKETQQWVRWVGVNHG